jgi:stage II sporulation protein P
MRTAAVLCLLALLAVGPDAALASPVGRAGELLPLPRPAPLAEAGPRHPQALVAVYTSHPREMYDDGTTIGTAAAALALALSDAGFRRVVLAPPDSAGGAFAYLRTRALVAGYAWRRPAWLVDVHRDNVPPGLYRGEVGGEPAARILLVVGSRNVMVWRNLPRVRAVASALEAGAPGLLRGVYLGPGDYNQDLGPEVILVELGNRDSTWGEVAASLPPLARALAAAAP